MTAPLPRPPRKDPLKRTRTPLRPPHARSRAGLGLSVMAATGRFALQACAECGAVQYPPRDICRRCLGACLVWRDVTPGGSVLAATTIRTSTDPYFRERTPWRVATVRLDCGVSVIAHLHGDCTGEGRVRLTLRLDRAGQGVFVALPPEETSNMADDPILRELGCDPKHRRVLITDARGPLGAATAAALVQAGAAVIFAGVAEPWKAGPLSPTLLALPGLEPVNLDLTDTRSVDDLAAAIGGRVDIVINTVQHIRPGGLLDRRDLVVAREELETGYLGFLRLAQAFGPILRGRAADGISSATAWVNLISVYGRVSWPRYGYYSASQAAVLSAAQALRAELAATGVRVCDVFFGPLDAEWHQELPPPKVSPAAVAKAVVEALCAGLEEKLVGDVAADVAERLRQDPRILQRELIP